jgi:hypothetical protein
MSEKPNNSPLSPSWPVAASYLWPVAVMACGLWLSALAVMACGRHGLWPVACGRLLWPVADGCGLGGPWGRGEEGGRGVCAFILL